MTSNAIASELLTEGGIDVGELPADLDVIDLLQEANERQPQQAWSFFVNISDGAATEFSVGLDGDRGVVTWWDGQDSFRPAHGSNTEPVDYWRGGHHSQLPAGYEISAEDTLAALREFLRTHECPTNIEWVME
ncbi:Immunity protein Imm1 [Actinopolyspora xinjiangensis]|uniref:Immunity protein Imm1 n=1 Tax=Actinopolyspora xinjiangensis TaxID=405564 RepID=A0A1H0WA95_9ACTN|nr:Imm1 family immunity protein [Actinopolyspora xinjiangensis]SDP87355.1 Immunity protein Imm1 [Actinopolyspora xinjiangensis]